MAIIRENQIIYQFFTALLLFIGIAAKCQCQAAIQRLDGGDDSIQYILSTANNETYFVANYSQYGPQNDPRTPPHELLWRSLTVSLASGPEFRFKPKTETTITLQNFTNLLDKSIREFSEDYPKLTIKSLGFGFRITDESWKDLIASATDSAAENQTTVSVQAFGLSKSISGNYRNMRAVNAVGKMLGDRGYKITGSEVFLSIDPKYVGTKMESLLDKQDLGIKNNASITLFLAKR